MASKKHSVGKIIMEAIAFFFMAFIVITLLLCIGLNTPIKWAVMASAILSAIVILEYLWENLKPEKKAREVTSLEIEGETKQ